ncbi:MAG TPA: hypothetical protein VMB35_03560 [Methanomicrobiales archaeon]|nr:hypothetical protein [Methanomicrobiales archaeon]
MGKQGFVAGPLTVLCILGLVMGTASALIITATGNGSSAVPGVGCAHPDMSDPGQQQEIISRLAKRVLQEREPCGEELPARSIDVTFVQAAWESGNYPAVKAWLEEYFRASKGDMPSRSSDDEIPGMTGLPGATGDTT